MADVSDFSFRLNQNVFTTTDLSNKEYDGVISIVLPEKFGNAVPRNVKNIIDKALSVDRNVNSEASVWIAEDVAGGRIVLSPTKEITPYNDSRSLYYAAKRGVERALKAGIKRPILVVQNVKEFPESVLVLLLGAFEALYVPIQVREQVPEKRVKIERLGVYGEIVDLESVLKKALALEEGRSVCRDVAGGDPERMTAIRISDYIKKGFSLHRNVTLKVIDDLTVIDKEYPLFAAVSRAANQVQRHQPRIIHIEYVPNDLSKVTETVMLVGKGVTYDTGGADVKTGGLMIGMSRDKSGAAAVAGFLKSCALLQPEHLRVVGVMCLARNSIGEESYLPDELLISRSGMRVRIGNTDAEGRLVMADSLCEMKDRALHEVNPHLYTIATLTGHAKRTVGSGYTIAMDNYAARNVKHAYNLQEGASKIGEAVDVSLIRQEDFDANRGLFEGDDVMQLDFKERIGKGVRGHQVGAGFMLVAGGLENSDVKYTHLDIAASCGNVPNEPTGAPILSLAYLHKLL